MIYAVYVIHFLAMTYKGVRMRAKFLSAVCFGALTIGSGVWGMDMEHSHTQTAVATEQTIHATGTVKSIADNHESIRIFHNPIPELRWPSMIMAFDVNDHELTHPLEIGDKVGFDFIQKEGKNIIVRMKKQ